MHHPPARDQTQVNSSSEVNKVRIVEVSEEFIKERNVSAIATELADAFKSEYKAKTFYVNDVEIGLMCWDGRKYYDCEAQALEFLEFNYRYNELDNYGIKRTSLVKEFMFALKHSTHYQLNYERLMISFNNVVLDWESLLNGDLVNAFKPHDPNIIVFHHIPHNLNVELLNELFKGLELYTKFKGIDPKQLEELASKYTPKTLKAFKDWVGDKWILLYEIIGYTLFPKYVLNKAIMLVGEGSNGKTTYLRLLTKILGNDNVVSVKLQDIVDTNKRFTLISLWRKLANVYDDLPKNALMNTGEFKVITGEGQITVDRKFREPITFTNYAKLIFATNELPKVYDMTSAFWRRWIVIQFPNKFPPNPTFFEDTFTKEEIENTIILSILAFYNVYKRRMFSFEESPEDYKEIWLRNANSVYAFLSDLMRIGVDNVIAEKDPNAKVETNQLYSLYVKYCEEQERESLAKAEFTKELERLGYPLVIVMGKRYYKGLKLKPQEPQNLTQT